MTSFRPSSKADGLQVGIVFVRRLPWRLFFSLLRALRVILSTISSFPPSLKLIFLLFVEFAFFSFFCNFQKETKSPEESPPSHPQFFFDLNPSSSSIMWLPQPPFLPCLFQPPHRYRLPPWNTLEESFYEFRRSAPPPYAVTTTSISFLREVSVFFRAAPFSASYPSSSRSVIPSRFRDDEPRSSLSADLFFALSRDGHPFYFRTRVRVLSCSFERGLTSTLGHLLIYNLAW